MRPRPGRVRQPAGRRQGSSRTVESPDRTTPPTWREWKTWIGRRRWLWPLAGAEWASEWVYYSLHRLAIFDLLELAGRCTVLVVAIFWLYEWNDRTRERHYRAWDLINSARGSTGDGGRRDALQDLNKEGVSLAKAPLRDAYLFEIDLRGADLRGADLRDADLQGAKLDCADLTGADLRDADLSGAKLQNAFLGMGAKLQSAKLFDADLRGASFWGGAELGPLLGGANIKNADLQHATGLTQELLNMTIGDDQTRPRA